MRETETTTTAVANRCLIEYHELEKLALELLQLVGELRYDHSIELVFFRKEVYDSRPSEMVDLHANLPRNYIDSGIPLKTSLGVAKSITKLSLSLPPTKIDIGQLAGEWMQQSPDESTTIDKFVAEKLHEFVGVKTELKPKDVVLYGFGRIGRMLARRIVELTGRGDQLLLKAIVVRQKMSSVKEELEKRAALLQDDSIHGNFKGTLRIDTEKQEIIVSGNVVKFIFADSPTDIDYTKYGIHDALLIDNTGLYRDKESLSQHLRPGISRVLLTAPGKGIPNIVHGINQHDGDDANIICAASCTTNAICPVLKVVDDKFGIVRGHIETVHSYTNDQNLLDNFHSKPRRGRGAPINMVLTSTGAKEAVAMVLPHIQNLTGNSVRVPIPDGSLAILNLTLKQKTTVEELNKTLRTASLHGELVEQLGYSTSTEFCSSSVVGNASACVIDSPSTIVDDEGHNVVIYCWYDNEYGYTCQVVRLAKSVSNVRRPHYY